jgi:class 3 adenylate cyclase
MRCRFGGTTGSKNASSATGRPAEEIADRPGNMSVEETFGTRSTTPRLALSSPQYHGEAIRMESATPLPGGAVTFLLTDIEGSTKLWEQHPEAMEAAVARHDTLAAVIVHQHAGTLVKQRGEGDSLFAVFADPVDAVTAATTLQLALCSEPWPSETPLRVRIALHTGAAALRDGDYYGATVNRCARLRAVAHGGQVLLSRTTRDHVRNCLPEGASLRDLGSHRLKDLQQPEQVYHLLHPDLPSDFPPLRSLEAFAHNLPAQLTSFIGREQAMAEVKQCLATSRLVTLTGSGGCGKTRLALQVAADLLEEYAGGVWLVELAPLVDDALVPQTVASALGVREEPGRGLTETLVEYLKPKALLLILDNCEHLLTACAQLTDALLRSCPSLRILASSREGLGIGGEQAYRVPSLALPDARRLPALERLQEFEAVQLFAERARFCQAAFAVTPANAPAVIQVCERLDGIPLAIELAAARLKALPVEKLNERLDDRFRLLTGGSRTALPRQQTLKALCSLGNVARDQGDYGAARALHEESLTICREIGDRQGIVKNLEGLAALAVTQAQPECAARLFGTAESIREAFHFPLPTADGAEHERFVAAVRAALGEEAFATAWAEGRAMTTEEAVTRALPGRDA